MDIYIDIKCIMFLSFDSRVNLLFLFTVYSFFSTFFFGCFPFPLYSVPDHLKDVQAINMHVGLNCAKQVPCYVDRLFSSNVQTKSPLWHCVGKSWSSGAYSSCSVLHRWPCSLQIGPAALPSQSDCLTSSGLIACSSGLTSFMGKYVNSSHGKNCHLVQVSWPNSDFPTYLLE